MSKRQTHITIAAPSEQAARLAALMDPTYRALRNPRITTVRVVGLSGTVSYRFELTVEYAS